MWSFVGRGRTRVAHGCVTIALAAAADWGRWFATDPKLWALSAAKWGTVYAGKKAYNWGHKRYNREIVRRVRRSMPYHKRQRTSGGPSTPARRQGPRPRYKRRWRVGRARFRPTWRRRSVRARPMLRRRFRRRIKSARSELKRLVLRAKYQQAPVETTIPAVSAISTCLGTTSPTAWNVGIDSSLAAPVPKPHFLDGIHMANGTGPNGRIGDKVNLKHTSLKMQVVMDYSGSSPQVGLPVTFRCLVIKVRRSAAAQPSTTHPELTVNQYTDLFRRTASLETFGPSTDKTTFWPNSSLSTGADEDFMNPQIFLNALVNKTKFKVYKDFKFTLGPPTVDTTSGTEYPNIPIKMCHKNLYFKLRHNKKVTYFPYGTPGHELPKNYDYRYQVFLFATYINQPEGFLAPDNWHVSSSGLTTFTDP